MISPALTRTPPPSVPIVDRRAKGDARCDVNCDDWTDPPLREPATLECYRRSHEIALAELDAAMAQDVVGGGLVHEFQQQHLHSLFRARRWRVDASYRRALPALHTLLRPKTAWRPVL